MRDFCYGVLALLFLVACVWTFIVKPLNASIARAHLTSPLGLTERVENGAGSFVVTCGGVPCKD